MTHAVIFTHGSLGQTFMDVVERVLGPQTDVQVLSNEGLSLEQMTELLDRQRDERPTILFADFCGGSTYVACKTFCERRGQTALVSGVNLPMLFSFFTKRGKLPFDELARVVETDAHRGIQLLTA